MKVYVEGIGTQAPAIQQELESKVATATDKQVGADGLLRIIVQGLVFVGKLMAGGRVKRFVVERCERCERHSDPAAEQGTIAPRRKKSQAPKAPPKRGAPKE